MEPLKDIRQFRDELLEVVNQQIATRQYMLDELIGSLYPHLDELIGSLYPHMVRTELERLEVLKQDILKLGGSENG